MKRVHHRHKVLDHSLAPTSPYLERDGDLYIDNYDPYLQTIPETEDTLTAEASSKPPSKLGRVLRLVFG